MGGVVHYSEGIFVGYRHYDAHDITPLFPFGYGLSYTTFGYKNLTIKPQNISGKDSSNKKVIVDFDVTNTGKRAGKEIAELYAGLPSTPNIPQPPKQLKAFSKVPLKPGQSRHVHFELDAHSLACWNTDNHGWNVLPGELSYNDRFLFPGHSLGR